MNFRDNSLPSLISFSEDNLGAIAAYASASGEAIDINNIESYYLGSGSFGSAYETLDGKVIKLTTDAGEAMFTSKLIGLDNKNLAKVYDVRKVDENYCILQEKLDTSKNEEYQSYLYVGFYIAGIQNVGFEDLCDEDIDEFIDIINESELELSNFKESNSSSILKMNDNIELENCDEISNLLQKNKEKFLEFSEAYGGAYREAIVAGIEHSDLHGENFGIKEDGTIAYFDPTNQDNIQNAERQHEIASEIISFHHFNKIETMFIKYINEKGLNDDLDFHPNLINYHSDYRGVDHYTYETKNGKTIELVRNPIEALSLNYSLSNEDVDFMQKISNIEKMEDYYFIEKDTLNYSINEIVKDIIERDNVQDLSKEEYAKNYLNDEDMYYNVKKILNKLFNDNDWLSEIGYESFDQYNLENLNFGINPKTGDIVIENVYPIYYSELDASEVRVVAEELCDNFKELKEKNMNISKKMKM